MTEEQTQSATELVNALVAALRESGRRHDAEVGAVWDEAANRLAARADALVNDEPVEERWAKMLRAAWFGPAHYPNDLDVEDLEMVWAAGQIAAAVSDLVAETAVSGSEELFVAVWRSLDSVNEASRRAQAWCQAALLGNIEAWAPDDFLLTSLTG